MCVGYNVLSHIGSKGRIKNMSRLISDLSSKVGGCINMEEQCAPSSYVLHVNYQQWIIIGNRHMHSVAVIKIATWF